MIRRLREDRRAVSVTVGYILMLSVAALLLGVVLTGAGGLMESQSKQVVSDELTVVGNQLASNIQEADRLATIAAADAEATDEEGSVDLTVRLPDRVAGTGYLVEIDDETITLSTTNPDVEVTVTHPETDRELADSDRLSGGDIRFVYNTSDDLLEVES